MSQFLMPSLGADMADGILVEQLIARGDPVHRGDIIAAVETQKGAIEIEVFEDGFLDDWLVPLGTKVAVGTPIANIRTSDTPDIPKPVDPPPPPRPSEAPQPTDPVAPPDLPEDPMPPPYQPPVQPEELTGQDRQRVSPAARRRAAQIGFDLSALGTDRIIALGDLPDTPAAEPMSAMRQAISAAMSRSKREIPHYYLSDSIDLTAAEDFITRHNANLPPDARLAIGALYVRAVALAAKAFPEFNGHFENERFAPAPVVHLGMVINLRGGGLAAPALHDAAEGNLDALMARLRDLVARVKKGRFRARELADPTITLTSLGDRGVSGITGVIFPPQVAIVGIGTPTVQAAVIEGQIKPRRIAHITLAADHRVSDGHRGALFLRAIIDHLQRPEAI